MELEEPTWVARAEVFGRRPQRANVRFEGLWLAGSLAGLERKTVAVVGTRAPSEAARTRAKALGEALGAAGLCVISGLALGVDGAAHAGALAAGAPTVGVLGGGHRHFFPPRNRQLAEAMVAAGGGVLSPYLPDEPARPWQFLQRNGIVAALADAVVIVEAAARSGALNTASWAANLGLDVLAFPGDVERPKAAGCNALIRDGATLVRNADDVLEALNLARTDRANTAVAARAAETGRAVHDPVVRAARDPLQRALLAQLATAPRDLDELVEACAAQPGAILAALMQLELAGAVRSDGATYCVARAVR